jgi:hypothetical protein
VSQVLDDRVDEVFESCRARQYDGSVKFSVIALSMAEIALGTIENRNHAYSVFKDQLGVSKRAYYGKVNRTEPGVSEGVVTYSADRALELMSALRSKPRVVLPGYRCLLIDGNHLQKTEHRLAVTRGLWAAALPGTIVARYDLQTELFDRSYLLEDAHAQECSVLDRVLADLNPGDVAIADRHFCIVDFMIKVRRRRSYFLIRQHGRLKGKLLGKRRAAGRTKSGRVYTQQMTVTVDGKTLNLRRVTLRLDTPTRDGDTELHILTNLPASKVNARQVAEVYHERWEIENAFYLLTTTLVCELETNCHPRCALFQFCMAQVAYNCRRVLFASLAAEFGTAAVEQVSEFYIARDIVLAMDGLLVAVNQGEWKALVPQGPKPLAQYLRRVSRHVKMDRYRKSVRGPKKPPTPRKRCKMGTHVSTAKLLNGVD